MNVRGVVAIVSLSLCVAVAHAQTAYDTLVKQGNAQLQAGNATSALASGQKAIADDPARWEAYTLTGGALMNLKRYDEAIDQLSEAISHAPAAKQAALRSLMKQCVLAGSGAAPATVTPATTTTPAQPVTTQAEIVLWKTIENSKKPEDFQGYLDQYPNGAFVVLAKQHLSDAQAAQTKATQDLIATKTWTDPNGLMWMQTTKDQMQFTAANQYCSKSTLAQFSDWRLPTSEEAQFLSASKGAGWKQLERIVPDNNVNYWHWTSSAGTKNGQHIVTALHLNQNGRADKDTDTYVHVLCVRNTK